MIPQEDRAMVSRALLEAFGVSECEDIRTLKDLASSRVYRIVVGGAPFLLKISQRTNDPARHYGCMRAAADAGLSPRVRYASIEDRVSIEDWVETAPFPIGNAVVEIPRALRKLHALPPFPAVPGHINTTCMFLMNRGPALDGFLQKVRGANLLPDDEREELFTRHSELAAVYPYGDAEMVSSHNDLFKPDNILYDGQRLWFIDWEAAFRNDCYADLAVAANLVVTNEAEERVFLQEYFTEPPDSYRLARFSLVRQITHMFYAMVYLLMGAAGKPVDWTEPAPEFLDFQRRMWAGEIDLSDSRTKIAYGKLHWERFRENTREARFTDALRTVSNRHAGSSA
jgi:hypothetical protein